MSTIITAVLGTLAGLALAAAIVLRSIGGAALAFGDPPTVIRLTFDAQAEPVADTREAAPLGSVLGPPSLTPAQIDAILTSYGSPAAGSGQDWYDLGVQYGIDPAYALAFFVHESTAGTAHGWAGWKVGGASTHNVGNIICAGYASCYGRFRDYPDWRSGIEDWYALLTREYFTRGLTTVATIVPVYAPSFENDVDAYVATVNGLVAEWRQ